MGGLGIDEFALSVSVRLVTMLSELGSVKLLVGGIIMAEDTELRYDEIAGIASKDKDVKIAEVRIVTSTARSISMLMERVILQSNQGINHRSPPWLRSDVLYLGEKRSNIHIMPNNCMDSVINVSSVESGTRFVRKFK